MRQFWSWRTFGSLNLQDFCLDMSIFHPSFLLFFHILPSTLSFTTACCRITIFVSIYSISVLETFLPSILSAAVAHWSGILHHPSNIFWSRFHHIGTSRLMMPSILRYPKILQYSPFSDSRHSPKIAVTFCALCLNSFGLWKVKPKMVEGINPSPRRHPISRFSNSTRVWI